MIYYNETDNVCYSGEPSDSINLTIVFNGSQTIRTSTEGGTGCNQWVIPYWAKILAPTMWGAIIATEPADIIGFSEETTRIHQWGILVRIIQKSTVKNPVEYKGVLYQCIISGSGLKEHFGNVNVIVLCQPQSGLDE